MCDQSNEEREKGQERESSSSGKERRRWLGYSQKNGLNDGNDIPIDVERRVFK